MGMFDYIRCEMPLPEAPANPPSNVFQTKGTPAQWMDHYVITADGLLIHKGYNIEDRSDPNAEGFRRFSGCMTKVYDEALDTTLSDFHGDIGFGTYDDKTGQDWDYIARFTEGRCVRIWLDDYCIIGDT